MRPRFFIYPFLSHSPILPVITCRLYFQNMYRTQPLLITCTTTAWSQPPLSSLCWIRVFKCHPCLYTGSSFSALLKPKSGKCLYLLKFLQALPISLRLKVNVFRVSCRVLRDLQPHFLTPTIISYYYFPHPTLHTGLF